MERFDKGCRGDDGHDGGNGRGLPVPATFVRTALVSRLRREIEAGSYRVDAHAVAARMLPVLWPEGTPPRLP